MTKADDLERYMLSLINDARANVGAPPLQLELNLNASAEAHSVWMLQEDIFSHTGEGGSSSTQRMAVAGFNFSGSWRSAENIAIQSERGAAGLMDDVLNLHTSLMNSPGHRANILNPDLRYIGIGIELGNFDFSSGTFESVIVTQNFAATQGQVELDSGSSGAEPPATAPAPQPPVTLPTLGHDVVVGTVGADLIDGLAGNDTLEGGTGKDTLKGSAGNDSLSGGDDNDLLVGGTGSDVLRGDAGNDLLRGKGGFDTLNGGDGNDTLHGNNSDDLLNGGNGGDLLKGGLGNDVLDGDAGNDLLEGDGGDDTLDGGVGDDVLRGGFGADNFVFRVGSGNDRVADFDIADSIVLESALFGGSNPDVTDLQDVSTLDNNGFLVLNFGHGDTLTFTGITNTGTILDDVSFI